MDILINAVIHSFSKAPVAGSLATKTIAPGGLLDVTLPPVQTLAEGLSGIIGKRENAVHWGQFKGGNRQGLFPAAVQELLDSAGSADAFWRMSEIAMSELVGSAERENFATGGLICFIHYQVSGQDFLLVAMAKEKGGISVTSNLVPDAITQVDMSKLHQAARINLTRFAEVQKALDDEQEELDQSYLCFVKSSNSDVAGYFQDALGCEPGISSTRSTTAVIREVRNFIDCQQEIKPYASKARRSVVDYLLSFADNDLVSLSSIVEVVKAALPPEQAALVDGLHSHLNSETVRVPSSFHVKLAAARRFAQIKAKGNHWELSFRDDAVSRREGELIYNHETKQLVINRLDDATIRRIEDSLHERGL